MNDTKYYVIMDGEYSDMGVVGITTDLELAEAFCKVSNAEYGGENYWIYNTDGTEFITDTNFIQRASKVASKFVYNIEADFLGGAKRWSICRKRSVAEETTDTATRFEVDENNAFKAKLHVYTDKEEVADKIAYDFLAKKNAEEIGL